MLDVETFVDELSEHVDDVNDQYKLGRVETHGVVSVHEQLRTLYDDLQRVHLDGETACFYFKTER